MKRQIGNQANGIYTWMPVCVNLSPLSHIVLLPDVLVARVPVSEEVTGRGRYGMGDGGGGVVAGVRAGSGRCFGVKLGVM